MNEPRINFDLGSDGVPNAGDANTEIRVGDVQCGQLPGSQSGPATDARERFERDSVELPSRDSADVYRPPSKSSASASKADWEEAEAKADVCRRFKDLVEHESMSLNTAARAVGKSPSWFSGDNSPYVRWCRGGVAALLPGYCDNGATVSFEVPDWFIKAARFFYLLTNRTRVGGSVPEAIRRVISLPNVPPGWQNAMKKRLCAACGLDELPVCPADLREKILARAKNGQQFVTRRIARQITSREATVRQYRHQTDAGLDYLSAPGALFFIHDSKTGERRPPYTGECIEADDATINFPVCVPWTLGGDPCSDKYGVKVGRFQWLVSVDVARRFITAWSYVMRPKSSYRSEDILTLVRAHCIQHGKPKRAHFEQGAWKSKLVKYALDGLGIELHTVWSPHQKPFIEGLFNTVWTKLSVQFPGCDVGRFMGETEEANDLLTSCQRGAQDPRRHFPMLGDAIAGFGQVVGEKNGTPVQSAIGSWIPSEAWQQRPPADKLDPETEWLFSPFVRTWTVRGMLVGGKVPLFEDLSVPFDFSADFLPQYHGAKVRVHFDPTAPRCHGMLVLAEDFHGERAGKVLGLAQQINEIAGYARLVLGWGDDPTNAGRLARQRAGSALRREVRAVIPQGGRAYSASEQRDGVSLSHKLETSVEGHSGPSDTNSGELSYSKSSDKPRSVKPECPPEISVEERSRRMAELEQFERDNAHLFQ